MASGTTLPKLNSFQLPALSQCYGPCISAPSTCYDVDDLVTINVKQGIIPTSFSMPRKLLMWHSSYFAAALDPEGGFAESGKSQIEIAGDIGVFEAFRCWIFTGRLKDTPTMSSPDMGSSNAEDKFLSPLMLCRLWVFGDFRGVPALKNAVIDMLHEQLTVKWVRFAKCIKYVYGNTAEGSQLQRFLADSFTSTVSCSGFLKQNKSFYTMDFVLAVLPIYVAQAESGGNRGKVRMRWAEVDRCKWHHHSGPGGKLRLENRT